MFADDSDFADASNVLIPLQADGDVVYLAVRRADTSGNEDEVSSRMPSVDEVIKKVTSLARSAVDGLQSTGASKVALEFGCEFAMESGHLVTIIGKASGKSTFKIGLEWSRTAQTQ